jgi:hypothetical protein
MAAAITRLLGLKRTGPDIVSAILTQGAPVGAEVHPVAELQAFTGRPDGEIADQRLSDHVVIRFAAPCVTRATGAGMSHCQSR